MTEQNHGGTGQGFASVAAKRSGLDLELALSRLGGDLELLHEIAQLFLSDSERMLREIANAVSARDAKALDRAAHTLKGCVSNFGAQRLYDASLALERMARSGDLTNIEPAYQTVDAELSQLEDDLRVLMAQG